jgi:hypothetical protein
MIDRRGSNTPTSRAVAAHIVAWLYRDFGPFGIPLDPCAGDGAFYDALPQPKLWCEIQRGRDFLDFTGHVDLAVTNPPFTLGFVDIYRHCFRVANNVALLVPISKVVGLRKRVKIARDNGFGIVAELHLPQRYVPGPFRQSGYEIGVVYWRRAYRGATRKVYWR